LTGGEKGEGDLMNPLPLSLLPGEGRWSLCTDIKAKYRVSISDAFLSPPLRGCVAIDKTTFTSVLSFRA
jgi:hypothetical protein